MENIIGKFIKEARKHRKLTQVEFAKQSNLGLRFVRELEQGKITCRVDKVNQALAFFGYELGPIKKENMYQVIYLAGGCFWGMEGYFKKVKGVISTTVGYANGNIVNPTYQQVKSHEASHAETVKIVYDQNVVSLTKLLEHLLRVIDPYSINHQGEDFGMQYRTGVYYTNIKDLQVIKEYFISKQGRRPFVIEVLPLANFYDAEEYHQDYLDKNPTGYCHINFNLLKESERK